MADYDSRAIQVGTGLKSVDLCNYGIAIKGGPSIYDGYTCLTAFENVTASDFWVALIEEWSKLKMELAIHPLTAKTILPIQGYMGFNIGTTLTDALGTLGTATYTWTSSPAALSYHVITVYATVPFYLKTLTNCTIVNNTAATNTVTGLSAGVHTLLVKATANTTTSILFDAIATGTPAGLAVTGYAVVVWTPNKCRAIK